MVMFKNKPQYAYASAHGMCLFSGARQCVPLSTQPGNRKFLNEFKLARAEDN